MTAIDIDMFGVEELARDLDDAAGQRVVNAVADAVHTSANVVRRDARRNIRGHPKARHYPSTITATVTQSRRAAGCCGWRRRR